MMGILVTLVFGLLSSEVRANVDFYYSMKRPSGDPNVPPQKPPWEESRLGGMINFELCLSDRIYIGVPNDYNDNDAWHKVVVITITGPNSHYLRADKARGYVPGKYPERWGQPRGRKAIKTPEGEETLTYFVTWEHVQPAWEWISFARWGASIRVMEFDLSFEVESFCLDPNQTYKDWRENVYKMKGTYGVKGNMTGDSRLNEIWLFPKSASVDTLKDPSFSAPPESGTWDYEFVYVDPNGDSRPQGGVKWSTSGAGLIAGDIYELGFGMCEEGNRNYFMFVYDSNNAEYESFEFKAVNPMLAQDPSPPQGAMKVPWTPIGLTLIWSPGANATLHDVYFGDDFNDVNEGTGGTYKGRIDPNEFEVADLNLSTTYYWRIDEVNEPQILKGDVWRFTIEQIEQSLDYHWTDANDILMADTDGDWMDPCNWSPVGVPVRNDTAVIGPPNPAGVPPIIDVDIGRLCSIIVDEKLFVRTGGDVYIDPDGGCSTPGDLLVGHSTNKPARLVMSGGIICGFDNAQFGKRAEGVLHMAADDVNDPGGNPLLWSCGDGYLRLGAKDGGTGDAKVYLDNGTIHVAGLHFYRDEATMDIAGGTLEAGPGRLEFVEGYYSDMKDYIEDLYYDKGWLTCYGGAGEINISLNQPQDEWVTVWCDPRDPNWAAYPDPKKRATAGPYDNECPNAAGSATKLVLSWDPGATADSHNVYLGTDESDVDAGTGGTFMGTVSSPSYTTATTDPNMLHLSTTYYWRIEEVNGVTVVGHGVVWQFTVPHCLCIDNFETYDSATFPTGSDWDDDGDDAFITLEEGDDYASAHGGTKSLNLSPMDYQGNLEADAYLDPTTITDWTYGGEAVALVLWYKVPFYATHVKVDINGNGFVDLNAIQDDCWHEANVTFAALGGGLNAVTRLTLRVGVTNNESGFNAYFDDIAVCEPRCVPDFAMSGDLDDDCDVDGLDLEIMGRDWLMNDASQGHYDVEFGGADANGPTWVNDPCRGWCLHLDGENDNLDIVDEPLAHFHDKTVAVWLNRQETGKINEGTGYIFYGYQNLYRTYFGIQTGRIYARLDGMSSSAALGPTTFAANEWHHLTWVIRDQDCTGRSAVRQSGLTDMEGYLDASIEVQSTGLPLHSNIYSLSPATIGSDRQDGSFRTWTIHAMLQDYRIYDYPLSQNEITYLATDGASGVAPDDSKLLMYFPMNQSAGTTVNETSETVRGTPNRLTIRSPANIDDAEAAGSRSVNFKDYSDLADQWGTTYTWP